MDDPARHYLDSVRDTHGLDPQFASLLRHHWMEEAQHAKLDTLMVGEVAAQCRPHEVRAAIEGYLEIGALLDAGLGQQVDLDLDSFERATRRTLTKPERDRMKMAEQQALRWTFLGSGMTHPNFLATVERLSEAGRARVETIAPMFS